MRWLTETLKEKDERMAKWKPWFAWHPVRIDKELVWFEWIYRRTKAYRGGMGDTIYETEYTDTMTMLKKQKMEEQWDGLE